MLGKDVEDICVYRSVAASEGLGVWGGLWIQVMGDLLLPLMADLARFVSTRARDFPGKHCFATHLVHMCVHVAVAVCLSICPLYVCLCVCYQGAP